MPDALLLSARDYVAQAESWETLERNKKAIECYEGALALLQDHASQEGILLRAECHQAIGTQWRLLGKLRQTGEHYQKAVVDFKSAFNDRPNLALGEIYFVLGSFLEQIWKLELAESYYGLALEQLTFCLGVNHPHILKVKGKIERIATLSPERL